MKPTEPGKYLAREITYLLWGRILGQSYEVEVVEGIPNERNHRLLVKTGLRQPRYKSLDCFNWDQSTNGEVG